ncbi:DUF488 domain-containing protein [Lacticaseibacillus camelliae]|uniref:Uroporphyrin-III C-methyltransferase n=1 Tax=Lacticaseibacillus camelliae DSM 22697 = JCM 13995 TaxID=1423730 RepID=A0A0R2EQR1_9LACO|nr:DUF488 family protein [Lacticaseibacillus camelliae]KRN18640.1 hypothetical protein FC75_GL000580 [Lacticaseibacillus camelliae DSM 22697 = JCM 13995]
MEFIPVRIYAHEQPEGYRLLVDRVWPRGVSKVNARLDDWAKQIAPSTELRKWYAHDPAKAEEFNRRYITELDSNPATPAFLQKIRSLDADKVLLLFGAKDEDDNNATVLADYLKEKIG